MNITNKQLQLTPPKLKANQRLAFLKRREMLCPATTLQVWNLWKTLFETWNLKESEFYLIHIENLNKSMIFRDENWRNIDFCNFWLIFMIKTKSLNFTFVTTNFDSFLATQCFLNYENWTKNDKTMGFFKYDTWK